MNEMLLTIRKLNKSFAANHEKKIHVVRDLDLDLARGEVVTLLAPSGYGKTSLLNMIAALDPPTSGAITWHRPGDVGYMFQSEVLLPWRNVMENILLGAQVKGRDLDACRTHALELMREFDLAGTDLLYPHELSGGMRQRVGLIQTLIYEPALLLLDEAFSSLDYVNKLRLEGEVYKWVKKHGATALLVTHDIEEAITMSDRILLFRDRPLSAYEELPVTLSDRTNPATVRSSEEFSELFSFLWEFLRDGEKVAA